MTPAINTAKKAKVDFKIHEYSHDPRADSYGQEAAEKLGVNSDQVFKTLVVLMNGKDLGVAVLPVSRQLNLKLFAKAMGVKKAAMADKKLVEKTTGYILGGVSPIGQKKTLSTVVHDTAKNFKTIFVSAGKRGLDMELAPDNLVKLTRGKFDRICE
ncbi:Cys-tRNA(Pro) deacylase [Desulfobacter curvatus]|uniref:Cys-tRNA(Pro) deacylase n=1 Tax=Desulfobacter curvatus TaxID=2290 RepID=UPI0003772D23|nr:Cys-tRNA(Pro) deacylase [Desulfobacter curvatus]